MKESAVVVSVYENKALLKATKQTSCSGCKSEQSCSTGLVANALTSDCVQFEVENTLNVKVGDQVVVSVPEQAVNKAALVTYLIPLLFMILAAIASDLGNVSDSLVAIFSFCGLGLGVLLAKFLSNYLNFNQFTPKLIALL